MEETKKCSACFTNLPISRFSLVSKVKRYPRPDCKDCQSQRVIGYKALKTPENYLVCNDCNKIMHKKNHSGRSLRNCCKYCKSNNLEEY